MFRKAFALALCALLPAALFACGQSEATAVETSSSSTPALYETNTEAPAEGPPETKTTFEGEAITPSGGWGSIFIAATDSGFYELVSNLDFTDSIVYYDAATLQKSYISSQPGSPPDETNRAYVEDTIGGVAPMVYGDTLYAMKIGGKALYQWEGESGLGYIIQMDLHGNNQQKLTAKPTEQFYMIGAIVCDGNFLYAMLYIFEDDESTSITHSVLAKLDVEADTTEYLHTYKGDFYNSNTIIIGTYEYGLVLRSELRAESPGGSTSYELHLLDLNDNTSSIALSWAGNEKYGFVYNNHYIYADPTSKTVYKLDLLTLEEEAFATLEIPDFIFDSQGFFNNVYDGRVQFELKNTGLEETRFGYLDLETGEIGETTLMLGDRGDEMHAVIYGALEEYYIVLGGKKRINFIGRDPAGEPIDAVRSVSDFWLIEKEDYWNNIPSYLKFEDNVFGS